MHSIQARSDSPGDVPARWSLQPLGAFISLEYGAGLPETVRSGDTFPVYGSSGQVGGHERPLVAGPGIIVGRKGSIGSVTWSQAPFWPIDTTYYVVLKSQQVALRWCYWLLHFLPLETLNSATGVPGLNRLDAYGLPVRLPPLPEQQFIAATLDRIEAHIQSSEQLIAKLKQVKKGLLHELLTCGIDAHGQVRDPLTHPELFQESPLGRIPREWEWTLLRSILTGIDAGKSPDCPDRAAPTDEWGILKVSAIHPGGFKPHENKVVLNPAYIQPAYEVHDGDLLISRSNTYELVGLVCFVRHSPRRLLLCDKTLRLNVNQDTACPECIFYVLQTSQTRAQIEMHATGTSNSMKNISQEVIHHLRIPLPPLQEQKRIAAVLHAHDARIASEEAHVGKLRQIKQALMDDLFTGRVRIQAMEETETARAESERG